MNDRLNIQDLIDLLAEKHGMDKQDADGFVKEFFLLIEQALESDRYVKIKGLGTFKLIDVDSRESVNVNTGERFQIQGHTKVSFTPDPVLRDTINKPFAHFETVVLNENTVLEDTPIEELEDEPDDIEETTDIATNEVPVAEGAALKEIVQVESAEVVNTKEEPTLKEEKETIDSESTTEIATLTVEDLKDTIKAADAGTISGALEASEKRAKSADAVDGVPTAFGSETHRTAEDIIAVELEKSNMNFKTILPGEKQRKASLVGEKLPRNSARLKEEAGKSPVPYLITVIILVLLLCGSALLFVYYPDFLAPIDKKEVTQLPVPQLVVQQDTLLGTVAVKDTVAEVAPEREEEVKQIPVATKKALEPAKNATKTTKPSNPVKLDSVNYKIAGTKTTYTIKEGETLTRVSLRFYGVKDLWPYIVQHNRDIIKNPDNVPYGTTLKIPELVKR